MLSLLNFDAIVMTSCAAWLFHVQAVDAWGTIDVLINNAGDW